MNRFRGGEEFFCESCKLKCESRKSSESVTRGLECKHVSLCGTVICCGMWAPFGSVGACGPSVMHPKSKTSYPKRRTPLIRIILDGELSGCSENPDNWIFLWK